MCRIGRIKSELVNYQIFSILIEMSLIVDTIFEVMEDPVCKDVLRYPFVGESVQRP